MIHNISIEKLHPHPDNPRKDLGDISELAESIKARGVMQNLTVVPVERGFCKNCAKLNMQTVECEEGHKTVAGRDGETPCSHWEGVHEYTVVIGHRRLASAKLAGLTEVPCAIADMTPQEQIATMLLENMQRSDLTVYEQAYGFQMMLDLGESVTNISEKTGFSETTVRRRVKLLELDQKKFKASIERGATLMDYAELEKIKDLKLRNSVLEKIGTSNFQWELQNAIDKEERPARKTALIAELETFAKKVKSGNSLSYVSYFSNFKKGETWKKPADANKVEYFYTVDNNSISLYKKPEKAEKKKASPEEKAFRQREAQLKDLAERAYELRYEFVKNFNAGKKHQKEIQNFVMKRLLVYGNRVDPDDLLKMLDVEQPEANEDTVKGYADQEDLKQSIIFEKCNKQPERILFIATYLARGDSKSNNYCYAQSWQNKIVHQDNETLNDIYDALISLGYEISDEEQAMRDGTHHLFTASEKSEE